MCISYLLCVSVHVCVHIWKSKRLSSVAMCTRGDARDSMAAICHTIPYQSGVNFPLHASSTLHITYLRCYSSCIVARQQIRASRYASEDDL